MRRQRPTASLNVLLVGASLACCGAARADDASACHAAAGTYVTGVVLSAPTFVHGSSLHGIELSHTHIALIADGGAGRLDIAADDVFASGYRPRQESVPAPLDRIKAGDRLSLCGIPYKGGMHWVHTNCGDTPTASDPDGWLKEIAPDGTPGENLEGATTYCSLWPRR